MKRRVLGSQKLFPLPTSLHTPTHTFSVSLGLQIFVQPADIFQTITLFAMTSVTPAADSLHFLTKTTFDTKFVCSLRKNTAQESSLQHRGFHQPSAELNTAFSDPVFPSTLQHRWREHGSSQDTFLRIEGLRLHYCRTKRILNIIQLFFVIKVGHVITVLFPSSQRPTESHQECWAMCCTQCCPCSALWDSTGTAFTRDGAQRHPAGAQWSLCTKQQLSCRTAQELKQGCIPCTEPAATQHLHVLSIINGTF